MLDSKVHQLVEQQIQQEVTDRIGQALNDQWLKRIENNAVKFIQDRILAKFNNSESMPELIDAVKIAVAKLFHSGQMPGLGHYVDYDYIKQSVDASTQALIDTAIQELSVDPEWLEKIEQQINTDMTQRVLSKLASADVQTLINRRVDEITELVIKKLIPGIQDQSARVELTILDKNVVVENTLTAKSVEAVDQLTVKNLVVRGTVNTDNASWQTLATSISQKTLDQLSEQWKEKLVEQVAEQISKQGIEFDSVKVNGDYIVTGNQLNSGITESNLRKVGTLDSLTVIGETSLNETVSVVKNRLGVNTPEPEMALSVWDEEVSLVAGKYKQNSAYFGTARKQALTIGVNKKPAVEINEDGLTAIGQLQVGVHRISHANEVPNYSGTKGDMVFNANPTMTSNVLGWQCLGGFKWKTIRSIE